jgi:2'-hydroxyisoflavone reductase
MTNRRQFLQGAVGAAGLAGLHAAGVFSSSATAAEITPADQKLKLLVLGGTGFIGPHEINHALARGHEVTMFNRGNRAGLYGGRVEEIVGNRDDKIDAGLEPLRGDRTWDVVVDNSGYVTRHVRDSVALLGDRCARYIYISTVAAYDFSTPSHFDEDGPLDGMKDPNDEQVTWETYGPLKADCDKLVRDALGKKATVVRPAYIIGPGDHTDRFTYWAERIHQGGDVIGPAHREVTVQVVDARDLCPWVITLAENDTPGAFNAAGSVWTREGLLWGIKATVGHEVAFHWPSPELAEELELPAPMLDWGSDSNTFGNAASRAAGLDYRTLADSTVDTVKWWRGLDAERRANPRGWPSGEQLERALARLKA